MVNIKVVIKKTKQPISDNSGIGVLLTDQTIEKRYKKVIETMNQKNLSSLIVYADKEHGSNFEYLVGFIPRFEEALLIINKDGSNILLLGNENFNKAKYSRIGADSKEVSLFSLPNQPINQSQSLVEILTEININKEALVGVVGWKLLSEMKKEYDLPGFIIDPLKSVIDKEKMVNATGLFIDPGYGVRVTNNANEIAHYEYGASLASDSVLEAMNKLEENCRELEIGETLNKHGQYNSVVTISAFGDRFVKGNLYPTENTLKKGDKISLTVGYRGGLSSRSGYAVENESDLNNNYFQEAVFPYFEAYNFWLTNLKIGKTGGDFYKEFDEFYPKKKFGWGLCPGHLTAEEEWLSSPFYENSNATVKSGMIMQIDFIPHQKDLNGISAESTIALADESLRSEIQKEYPELWMRIKNRKKYMREELNIHLPDEVLPLTSTVGYYRPFLLNKEYSLYRSE